MYASEDPPITPANAITVPISVSTVAGIIASMYKTNVTNIRRSGRLNIELSYPSCARGPSKHNTTATCRATKLANGYVANIVIPNKDCAMNVVDSEDGKLFNIFPFVSS
mmetsp:Transcript_30926/g.34746  ORF Transcript_30926/g.34746 Transcript_30926/m.34746 type:complete len:109 (-) Transcript_30926:297-623(-)